MANNAYSGSIAVNTTVIEQTRSQLQKCNDNMDKSFETFKNKCKDIEDDWKSEAGNFASSTMYELFKCGEARSTVMQNYINILLQQVNPGYISAENANKSLADNFK